MSWKHYLGTRHHNNDHPESHFIFDIIPSLHFIDYSRAK